VLLPVLRQLHAKLTAHATDGASISMMARTHGQAATPTTVGKEFATMAYRLAGTIDRVEKAWSVLAAGSERRSSSPGNGMAPLATTTRI
jgi:adenylosuccinate lyase